MSLNKIAIRTNKGEYVGGEKIYGAVYLWICTSTEACRAVKLKFKGYEKCEWEYREVTGEQNGRLEEKISKKSYKKDKFRAEVRLVEYEGVIPMGCYAYPFQYTLQQELPASFKDSGFHGMNRTDKWEAEIQYTVTAEVEMLGSGRVLQEVQPIIINKNLPLSDVQGEKASVKTTIKICCCIPRGDVSLTAWLDKKAYVSGETAKLHVETENSSSVDIDSFVVKLVRVVTLWPKEKGDSSGSHEENTAATLVRSPCIPNSLLTIQSVGCKSKATASSDVPLLLKNQSTDEDFQPSADGELVKSIYHVDAGMEVRYDFPVSVHLPITIQAPKNKQWQEWEPPTWLYKYCNVVNTSGPCAVPEHQLGSRLFAHVPGFQTDPFS